MHKNRFVFEKYFPEHSVEYCFQLWQKFAFHFKITPPRKSVYGSYRFLNGRHIITVNGNLQPEAFLVTYIHEVAHLSAFEKFGRRLRPHGEHWQAEFRDLMQPVLSPSVFKEDVLMALTRHLANPSSTSCVDEVLHTLLQKGVRQHEDSNPDHDPAISISSLLPGQHFLFEGRTFKMERKMRKRFLCTDIRLQKNYLFQPVAAVIPIASDGTNGDVAHKNRKIEYLEIGSTFSFAGRNYEFMERRRTKALCKEMKSGNLYLIPLILEVDLVL